MNTVELFDSKGLHKWFADEINNKNAVINNLPLEE